MIVILNMDLTMRTVSQLHKSGIGSQESVPENPSPIPSDAMTVLYPNPDEGDTLLSHTLVDDPSHTLPKMTVHIPVHTPSSCDDDAFLPDLAETEPATPVPVCTEKTLSAAEILADLSEGIGGVSAIIKVLKVFNCSKKCPLPVNRRLKMQRK